MDRDLDALENKLNRIAYFREQVALLDQQITELQSGQLHPLQRAIGEFTEAQLRHASQRARQAEMTERLGVLETQVRDLETERLGFVSQVVKFDKLARPLQEGLNQRLKERAGEISKAFASKQEVREEMERPEEDERSSLASLLLMIARVQVLERDGSHELGQGVLSAVRGLQEISRGATYSLPDGFPEGDRAVLAELKRMKQNK